MKLSGAHVSEEVILREGTDNDITKLGDDFIAPEKRPLIPEGKYEAQCIKIEKGYSHSSSRKIFIHFKIVDWMNLDDPQILFMAMNDPGGKPSVGTKYYKNWVIANGNKTPERRNRMSMNVFRNQMFEVQVETVKPKFPDGEGMPECFHYSIVRYIKRRLTGAT